MIKEFEMCRPDVWSVGHLRKRPRQGRHLQEHRPIRSITHEHHMLQMTDVKLEKEVKE